YISVYKKSIDNFKGVLDIYKLFDIRKEDLKESILENLEVPLYLPETIKLSLLLKEMGKEKLIFIVDEYGDIQGMLDSEEIMNNFFTLSSVFIKKIDENRFEINPQTALYEIEVYLEDDIFEETGDKTVIEFFLEQLNRIPKENDLISVGNVEIIVNEIEEFRVKSFIIKVKKDDRD
ncbi:hypothetical protein J7L48_00515, partial [bacterium]|nr:hypothetical protein [bacterium]